MFSPRQSVKLKQFGRYFFNRELKFATGELVHPCNVLCGACQYDILPLFIITTACVVKETFAFQMVLEKQLNTNIVHVM